MRSVLVNRFESRQQHARRLSNILQSFDAILLNDSPFGQAILGCLDERTAAIPILHSPLTAMVRNATANAENWDVLVAVSPAVLESAVQFGIARDRVTCIHNGIPVPTNWPKSRNKFGNKNLSGWFILAQFRIDKKVSYTYPVFY